jgi:hypothetical protein
MNDTTLHLWSVTSGWEGPFQLEEVLVTASGSDEALSRAERAFAEARQPVCRAKVRVADLGALTEDLVVGPRRADEWFPAERESIDRRCAPEAPASDA